MFCGGGAKFKDTQILEKKFKKVYLGDTYFKGPNVVLVDNTKEGTGNMKVSKEDEAKNVIEELKRLRESNRSLDEKLQNAQS